MDSLIKRFDAVIFGNLSLCEHRGIAYQITGHKYEYEDAYWTEYQNRAGTKIANRINDFRLEFIKEFAKKEKLLDVGIGSGEFLTRRNLETVQKKTYGVDVNPRAKEWLKEKELYSDNFEAFNFFTFWDVVEHVDMPELYFRQIKKGGYLFTSIPIFNDLHDVPNSKHYKPGEHLYYFTEKGFIDYMSLWGFRLLKQADGETQAGRESILSFAFIKDLPDRKEMIGLYDKMHSEKHYGDSAHLYFKEIADLVIKLNPVSILDYGCGRSDLSCYFWNDGKRMIRKFDPAIVKYKEYPEGEYGLVLAIDILEHIRMADIDYILKELRDKSMNVIFVISMKPARAKLPDGQNAHVTLLTKSEWMRWIKDYFGKVYETEINLPESCLLRTFK